MGGTGREVRACRTHAGLYRRGVPATIWVVSKAKDRLDPNAPGLDEMTRKRRRALASMQKMSTEELIQLAVRAGICTKQRKLTKPYANAAS